MRLGSEIDEAHPDKLGRHGEANMGSDGGS